MWILMSCAVIAVLFLAVILIRAAMFKPPKKVKREVEKIEIDEASATEKLAEMIRCKTVSDSDKNQEDEKEFLKFKGLLPRIYPTVFEKCDFEEPSERSMLFRWRGRRATEPTVLMAHYDVVYADESKWDKPAFLGVVENGVIWGRGVIDTKGSLNAILYAAESLMKEGFIPEHDVYFAFGGDEEISGVGAPSIVKLFSERGISPSLVLDEGGAVVSGVFPGVREDCAVVGIAEKGMVNIEYSINGNGGHSSAPLPHTPVGKLSSACVKVEKSPFKFRITEPTLKMFKTLGRYSAFAYRIVFANLGLFAPVLNLITKRSGGQLNAIARTTVAFTQMQGSDGMNVIPPNAKMVSNSRILPGESVESTVKKIEKILKNSEVEVRKINGMNPSPISLTEGEGWNRVTLAIEDTFDGAIVSPYLMTACSDSRHWSEISDKVYRFSPFRLTKEENGCVHGNNERLPTEKIAKAAEFYVRLMKMS